MKKYLSGAWSVFKNYIFAMIFFYIFYVGFYSKASLFSIFIFIIMFFLIYGELAHKAGVDRRKYGEIKLYDGALYALLAILPVVLIQIIISQLNLSIEGLNFAVLKTNLVKAFAAPMLFLAKALKYSVGGYLLAWGSVILMAFLGYFAGYKNFELDTYIRKLFGLQPRKPKQHKKNKR